MIHILRKINATQQNQLQTLSNNKIENLKKMNQLRYETAVISSFILPCQQTVFFPDYTVTAIINEGIVYLLKSCSTALWNVWTSLPADHLTVLRKHRIKQKHINLKQKLWEEFLTVNFWTEAALPHKTGRRVSQLLQKEGRGNFLNSVNFTVTNCCKDTDSFALVFGNIDDFYRNLKLWRENVINKAICVPSVSIIPIQPAGIDGRRRR